MKKKFLLPILLLATLSLGGGLVACNQTGNKSSQTGQSYSVAISNKEAFAEWYAGTNRDLDLTLTPEANALQELNEGNLTVTSSDETVVKPSGLGLAALKAGTAKITVSYHGAEDSLDVTVIDNSAKAKYGVAHNGTAEDPFTNEDALAVAKSTKYEGEVYYVKGKVASFYNAPGSRDDGMVAWFLEPATAGGEKFEIYKCFKEGGGKLTDDDIWVGGEATAYGAFTVYGTQYETSSATFVKCEGNKPAPRQTLTKTFAETLAAGVALADGADTWDYYKFEAYVTVKSGTDFYVTATKGEALVAGKSDAAHGEKDIKGTNAIELYGAGKDADLAAKLLEGAKVEITMVVKNYHGTVENAFSLTKDDVVVKEAGEAWKVPEPAVAEKTLAEFIALENKKDKAYKVTATIKSWKNATAEKDQFGNMVLTDGTNDLVIYGASATETALAWDNAGAYAFTNPKDFLTNAVTAALKVGDEITMKLIRADYTKDGNTTIQGTGVILVDAPSYTSLAKYGFTTQTAENTRSIDAAGVKALFTKVSGEEIFDEATTVTNVYEGASGGSGENTFKVFDILKIGKSKTAGTLAFKVTKDVAKIAVKGVSWTATATITVNGKPVAEAFKDNIISKATIADGKVTNAGSLEFEFDATKEITIEVTNSNANANFGVVFTEIEFFAAGEAASTGHEHNMQAVTHEQGTGEVAMTIKKCADDKYYEASWDADDAAKTASDWKNRKLDKTGATVEYKIWVPEAMTARLYVNAKYNNSNIKGIDTSEHHTVWYDWRSDKDGFKVKVSCNGTEVDQSAQSVKVDGQDVALKDLNFNQISGYTKSNTEVLEFPWVSVQLNEGANTIKLERLNGYGHTYQTFVVKSILG